MIAILGQNYLSSIISQGDITKSLIVMSNKRVYQQGALYHFENSKAKKRVKKLLILRKLLEFRRKKLIQNKT